MTEQPEPTPVTGSVKSHANRPHGRGRKTAVRPGIAVRVVLLALLVLAFYTGAQWLDAAPALAHDPLLDAADYAGYTLCHRITERSFTVAGRQLPLCARCTGMYLAISLVFGVLALAGRWRRVGLPPLRVLLLLGGLVALMGIDGINSYSHFFPDAPHLYEPRNWLRLLTGLGTGTAMGIVVFPALAQTLWQEQEWLPSISSVRELGGVLLLVLAAGLLVLSNQTALLYVLAIVSAAGVVLILASLNTVFVLILLRRDGRAGAWWQALLPLLVGVALAVAQIALVSWARYALTGTMTGIPGL